MVMTIHLEVTEQLHQVLGTQMPITPVTVLQYHLTAPITQDCLRIIRSTQVCHLQEQLTAV